MCLILVAWRAHPDYPLVVAANRDEFFARASAQAGFWTEAPDIFAGRDLEAGGTWLGISRQQRFAALTNFRDGLGARPDSPSRGALVADFLSGSMDPKTYSSALQARANDYNGFNLLFSDGHELGYLSNRHPQAPDIHWLSPGIYGLSNHLLDTPWPKLTTAKRAFSEALQQLPRTEALFELLADDEIAADAHLPATGVSLPWERVLSAIFVRAADYGTRASTVLSVGKSGVITFQEKSFGREAKAIGEIKQNIQSSVMKTGV